MPASHPVAILFPRSWSEARIAKAVSALLRHGILPDVSIGDVSEPCVDSGSSTNADSAISTIIASVGG